MQTTHNMKIVTLALTATTIGYAFVLPATADEETTTTTTGVGKYNVPISDTTTRTTIQDPGPVQEVTKKHTVYTRLSPADASQTIVKTESSNSIKYGRENYGERLHNFRSQLDKAISSNWVSAAQATDLNSQYDALVAQEAKGRGHNYTKAERDEFETSLNAFNIRLSDAMSKAKK